MNNVTQLDPSRPGTQGDVAESALSALIDGELPAPEAEALLRRLHHAPETAERYAGYCAVGDALRGDLAPFCRPGFTDRVMAALENEPTVLAPMARQSDRKPLLWLAAAAVSAVTWGLWSALPAPDAIAPMASLQRATPQTVSATQSAHDVEAYLAAHQDFAQAVIAPADMQYTQVSLTGGGQ